MKKQIKKEFKCISQGAFADRPHTSAKAAEETETLLQGRPSPGEASETQLLLNKVTAWAELGKQTFPLELPQQRNQADILEPSALEALTIKMSLLSQKEHCAKLFQLRNSLRNEIP